MTSWTFPCHRDYERALRVVAAAWFVSKGFAISKRYGYILADRVCDSRSPTFAYGNGDMERGMTPFLLSLLPDEATKHIAVVTIQDVAEAIRASGRHEWINEFEAKYGLAREVES